MTAFYAPDPINSTQLIPGTNIPATGALLFCYQVGSSTKQNTYTDQTASTARTNPIVLDSGGNIPGNGEVWIASTAKFVLAPFNDTDPPLSPYWTRDNLPGVNDASQLGGEWIASGLTPTFVNGSTFTFSGDQTQTFTSGRRLRTINTAGTLYSTIGSSAFATSTSTLVIQSDTTGIDSGLSSVSYGIINPNHDSLPNVVSVKRFGAKGDGVTDDSAALQAAINSVSLTGGILYFPPGTYNTGTTTLIFKNNIHYLGSMRESAISYTGTSDAVQVNNLLNTSTIANIIVEKLTFTCTTRTAGKASFADTGSAVISWIDCTFQGNDFGLIFDQTNLAVVERCIFTLPSNGTASIWGINGADRSVGASSLFTNRLTIRDSLFLSAGTAGNGIALDGGVEYILDGNQFEGLNIQCRFTGCVMLSLRNNWFELPNTNCIAFKTATLMGGTPPPTITCDGVEIRGASFVTTGAKNTILFDGNSVISLENVGNNYSDNNAGAAAFSGLAGGVSVLYGFNNSHSGTGSSDVGNSTTLNGPSTLTGQFACGVTAEAGIQAKIQSASTDKTLKLVRNDAGVSGQLILELQNGSGGGTTVHKVDSLGVGSFKSKLYPGTDASALQTSAGLYAGSGAPNNANGSDGDYYFRSDGGVGTHIYFKAAGVWAGII